MYIAIFNATSGYNVRIPGFRDGLKPTDHPVDHHIIFEPEHRNNDANPNQPHFFLICSYLKLYRSYCSILYKFNNP